MAQSLSVQHQVLLFLRGRHNTSCKSSPCIWDTMPPTAAALQRAKDLHPDLKASFNAADGEAFLRLVAAYEVLSDPQQRQLYDIASNSKLPGALKRAAAAAAAAADGGGGSSSGTEDAPGGDAGGLIHALEAAASKVFHAFIMSVSAGPQECFMCMRRLQMLRHA